MDKNLLQRLISGFFYGLVILLCTTPLGETFLGKISPWFQQHRLYFGLMAFFMAVGVYECVKLMKFGKSWERFAVVPLAIYVFYIYAKRYFNHGFYYDLTLSEGLALSLILIAVLTVFRFKEELYNDGGKLIFTVIYSALTFGFALAIPQYTSGGEFSLEAFMLFVLIWSSDSFAYFSGRLFGKHKMAPTISPKKTWEGFAGGVILTLLLGFFVERQYPELRGNWMMVGLLTAVFAPIGDLVESQLKRTFGVKDSGNIIPGHGGVLDRLDSFILCAPVIYLYFLLEKLI
ncbi:phosphatidate cytidylyltransferase [Bergeyella sp. RCAD1439]|uniref:phosphatidate cytidylyltransferase n=1 Tax=Bergeyella anatis TaxID=3113737 RepID=UPI002E19D453|nr:phosphatidate cytidylyltransferase [Bergeyella sp. RCAD1439]